MERDELIRWICETVKKKGRTLKKEEWEDSKICSSSEFKNGLYFLYNKQDTCIYVGKVGDGPFTSLYRRMVGHGGGSHRRRDKRWYPQVSYVKWYQFNVSGKELSLIERLAIFGMKQPIYNDMDSDQSSIDRVFTSIEQSRGDKGTS